MVTGQLSAGQLRATDNCAPRTIERRTIERRGHLSACFTITTIAIAIAKYQRIYILNTDVEDDYWTIAFY